MRCRRAVSITRSADTPSRPSVDLHASRPGRPKCAAASHLQQNPRRWRPALHQGDHTHLGGLWSQMRCRRVLLLASRISVPSPATPCTLITPNGAPRGQTSRICFLPFAGANAGVRFRMVMPSHLSTLYLVSHADALYTESPLGCLHRPVAHIERMRLFSVQYAPPTHGQPQCDRGADCHAHWLAPIKSRRRRSLQLVQLLWRRPPAIA